MVDEREIQTALETAKGGNVDGISASMVEAGAEILRRYDMRWDAPSTTVMAIWLVMNRIKDLDTA